MNRESENNDSLNDVPLELDPVNVHLNMNTINDTSDTSVDINNNISSNSEHQPINTFENGIYDSKTNYQRGQNQVAPFIGERKFGWFGFTPHWLQWINRPVFLFFTLASATFAYHMGTGGIFNAVVGTLVRRYELSNTQIGVLATSMNILSIFFVLIASHYGESGHKGKWLGWSFILYAFGAVVFTLPQWISPLPFATIDGDGNDGSGLGSNPGGFGKGFNQTLSAVQLCDPSSILVESVNAEKTMNGAHGAGSGRSGGLSSNWGNLYFWIFLGARLIQTIAAATTPLKLTYIDENVEQKNSAIYTTLIFLVLMASTGIGMVVGGLTLKVHADSYRADVSDISLGDKDWYGAWWSGYILVAIICLLTAIPIFGFPRDLPGKEEKRKGDIDQSHQTGGGRPSSKKVPYGRSWSDFPRSLAVLIQNPVFTLLTIRNGIQVSMIVSINIFMVVYLREAFGIDESMGSIVVALCWLLPGMLGSITGAALIKIFRMQVRKILIMAGITTVISKIMFMSILYHCPTQAVAGVNTGYDHRLGVTPLGGAIEQRATPRGPVAGGINIATNVRIDKNNYECNSNCGCSIGSMRPVCDLDNGVLYPSPCLAGCELEINNKTFSNCKCSRNSSITLVEQRCPLPDYCKKRKYVFLIFTALASFTGGMGGTPSIQAGLRSVPFEKRTLAMGIQSIGIKVLIIPGPIIIGALMDRSCLVEMPKSTKGKGKHRSSCFQYDATEIGKKFAIFAAFVGIIGTILLTIAILLYRPIGGKPWYQFRSKSGVAAGGWEEESNPPVKAFGES